MDSMMPEARQIKDGLLGLAGAVSQVAKAIEGLRPPINDASTVQALLMAETDLSAPDAAALAKKICQP